MENFVFESLTEAVELALDRTACADTAMGRERNLPFANRKIDSLSLRDAFYGPEYRTAQDVLNGLSNPLPHIVQAVEQAREALESKLVLPKRKKRKLNRRLEAGDELNADAWLARDPNAWEQIQRIVQESRTARIAVNLSMACGEPKSNLVWRGATAAALADLLTTAGVATEITALSCLTHVSADMPRVTQEIVVKPMDAPLDLGAVAFCLADAVFFRMVVLNNYLRKARSKVGEGIGRVATVFPEVRDRFDLVLDTTIRNTDTATQFVTAAMADWKNN